MKNSAPPHVCHENNAFNFQFQIEFSVVLARLLRKPFTTPSPSPSQDTQSMKINPFVLAVLLFASLLGNCVAQCGCDIRTYDVTYDWTCSDSDYQNLRPFSTPSQQTSSNRVQGLRTRTQPITRTFFVNPLWFVNPSNINGKR